ncbi:MAG: hypothetical protein NXI12_04505 [Alphaproteobacteria bacterium]|nr:hypothetical protein [Alphaproteobacteria bacterium]
MTVRDLLMASALAAAAPLAAAQADGVRDVMIVDRGGPHVWIALDAAPQGIEALSAPGRLSLMLAGVSLDEARRIIPVNGGPLRRVTATPGETGAQLILEGDFASAEAELRQGGVWIALDGRLSGDTPARAPHAVAYDGESRRSSTPSSADGRTASGHGIGDAASGPMPEEAADGQHGAQAWAARDVAPSTLEPASMPDLPPPAGRDDGRADAGSAEAGVGAGPEQSGPCDATAAAVQESPWDLDALTRHADCLAGLGPAARDNAAGLYERVLAFDPTHFRAAIGLARIREAQGRGQEAAQLYERAANAALTDGEALAARAAADRSRDDEER